MSYFPNVGGQSANYLRKLLESGQITQSDLSDMQMNDGFDSPPPPQAPQPQQPQNALARMLQSAQPGQGYQGLQSGQGVVQQTNEDGSQNAPIQIDSRQSQQPQMPERDVTRNPIDLPGGRGYWGKDGQVYTANGSLYETPETRSRTNALSMAAQDRQLKIQEMQGKMALTEAQTTNLNLKPMTQPEKPHYDAERGVFVQMGPDGKASVIKPEGIEAKAKPLTESQAKAAGLGSRAQSAHDILNGLENGGTLTPGYFKSTADAVPLVGNQLGGLVNRASPNLGGPSSEQQRVEQAQRDFVNAALRVESGASISEAEFNNARKQYFPQHGDEAPTIKQKQESRAREIQALAIQAGRGGTNLRDGGDNAARGNAPSRPLPNALAVSEAKNNPAVRAEFIRTFGADMATKYGIR